MDAINISPWNDYTARIPIATLGPERDLIAKFTQDYGGNPAPLDASLVFPFVEGPAEEPENYVCQITAAAMLPILEARVGDQIALHFTDPDGIGYHTQDYVNIVDHRPRVPFRVSL